VARVVKYLAFGALREDQFGASSHTDAGFITMLPQSNQPELHIKTPDGEWIDHPPMAQGVIVNSGNMLRRWSNDRFVATPHRVTTATTDDRYSLAFLFNPDLDDVIDPVAGCCGPGNSAKNEPIRYEDLFADYLASTYTHQRDKSEAAE
jgi:isopenicillin N synthase-like dioxygenase